MFAYELIVNLNKVMYDFYDWDSSDELVHIRKTPFIKVSNEAYIDLISRDVVVDDKFLEIIKDKTLVSEDALPITYGSVITNGSNVSFVSFSSDGKICNRSKMSISEELELMELSYKIRICNIGYKVIGSKIYYNKLTRNGEENIKKILDELYKIKEEEEKIDYLYYEWFNTEVGSDKYKCLVNDIKKRYSFKHIDFLETLNMVISEKKV